MPYSLINTKRICSVTICSFKINDFLYRKSKNLFCSFSKSQFSRNATGTTVNQILNFYTISFLRLEPLIYAHVCQYFLLHQLNSPKTILYTRSYDIHFKLFIDYHNFNGSFCKKVQHLFFRQNFRVHFEAHKSNPLDSNLILTYLKDSCIDKFFIFQIVCMFFIRYQVQKILN